jgi:hypothetical protein
MPCESRAGAPDPLKTPMRKALFGDSQSLEVGAAYDNDTTVRPMRRDARRFRRAEHYGL